LPGISPAREPRPLSKEFSFPGDVHAMPAAREAVMDFLKPCFASELDEIDVLVALQEALANAALHGCQNDPSKIIHCAVEIEPSSITITVCDPGPGFDVEAVTQATECGANVSEHGRGIALMRGVMDEVTYHNGGSEVQLRKRLAETTASLQERSRALS